MTISIWIIIILLVIAIPIGLAIGKATDKTQGKNAEEWKEYQRQQGEISELEERLKELKGDR